MVASSLAETLDEQGLLRKRLYYQSLYRGCKELDVLLSRIAASLDTFSRAELTAYAELLELQDPPLLAHLVGRQAFPPYISPALARRFVALAHQQKY